MLQTRLREITTRLQYFVAQVEEIKICIYTLASVVGLPSSLITVNVACTPSYNVKGITVDREVVKAKHIHECHVDRHCSVHVIRSIFEMVSKTLKHKENTIHATIRAVRWRCQFSNVASLLSKRPVYSSVRRRRERVLSGTYLGGFIQ